MKHKSKTQDSETRVDLRKLFSFGNYSIATCIPIEWVRSRGINPGDWVKVKFNHKLEITPIEISEKV